MSQQVDAILCEIERLDEADRRLLETRLHDLAEARWREEADAAREDARQRGVDQRMIDQAVGDVRYGS